MFRSTKLVWRLLCFFCLVEPASAATALPQDTIQSIRAISKATIEHRQAIRSGHVNIKSVMTGDVNKRFEFSIWFDGDRLRGDILTEYSEWKVGDSYRESYVRNENGNVLHFSEKEFADGGTLVASIRKPGRRTALSVPPDPRLIGLFPTWYFNLVHHNYNSFLNNPVWVPVQERLSQFAGNTECDVITFKKAGNSSTVEAWFDRERDNSIVRYVTKDGEGFNQVVDYSYQHVKGFGWFPKTGHLLRIENGEKSREEHLNIEVVQFNDAISDDVYTLAGMGVPEGHEVRDRTASGVQRYVIRDGQLVDPTVESYDPVPRSGTLSKVLLFNGLLLGGLIVYMAFFRKK